MHGHLVHLHEGWRGVLTSNLWTTQLRTRMRKCHSQRARRFAYVVQSADVCDASECNGFGSSIHSMIGLLGPTHPCSLQLQALTPPTKRVRLTSKRRARDDSMSAHA